MPHKTLYRNDGTGRDNYVNNTGFGTGSQKKEGFWPAPESPSQRRQNDAEASLGPSSLGGSLRMAATSSLPPSPSAGLPKMDPVALTTRPGGVAQPASPLARSVGSTSSPMASSGSPAAVLKSLSRPMESSAQHAMRVGRFFNDTGAPTVPPNRLPTLRTGHI